jgi:hypothetical protein
VITSLPKAFRSSKFAQSLILVTCIAVSIVVFVLVFFAEPIADDFWFANAVDVRSAVETLYLGWSGRWASHGLEALLLTKLPMLSIYSGILWGLHAVHFIGLFYFWHLLVGSAVPLRRRLILALASYVFLFAGYSEPGETVYWVTGAIENQLPLSLMVLLLAMVHAGTRSYLRPSRALPLALALGLVAFTIPGLHQLAALILLGVLFTGALFVVLERRPNLMVWILLLMFAVLGTAISIFAPGNAVRAAKQGHGLSISEGIIPLIQLLMKVSRWIDLKLVAASVLVLLTLGWQTPVIGSRPDRAHLRAKVIPLVGVALVLGTCASIAYLTASTGPPRVQNFLYETFCMAWFASLVILLKATSGLFYRPDDSSGPSPVVRIAHNVAAVLFCISLITSPNIVGASRDLLTNAVDFRRAMTHRYDLIRRAARLDGPAADVVVPPVVRPQTFYRVWDIGPDHNEDVANYFGVRSVRLGRPGEDAGTAR